MYGSSTHHFGFLFFSCAWFATSVMCFAAVRAWSVLLLSTENVTAQLIGLYVWAIHLKPKRLTDTLKVYATAGTNYGRLLWRLRLNDQATLLSNTSQKTKSSGCNRATPWQPLSCSEKPCPPSARAKGPCVSSGIYAALITLVSPENHTYKCISQTLIRLYSPQRPAFNLIEQLDLIIQSSFMTWLMCLIYGMYSL